MPSPCRRGDKSKSVGGLGQAAIGAAANHRHLILQATQTGKAKRCRWWVGGWVAGRQAGRAEQGRIAQQRRDASRQADNQDTLINSCCSLHTHLGCWVEPGEHSLWPGAGDNDRAATIQGSGGEVILQGGRAHGAGLVSAVPHAHTPRAPPVHPPVHPQPQPQPQA